MNDDTELNASITVDSGTVSNTRPSVTSAPSQSAFDVIKGPRRGCQSPRLRTSSFQTHWQRNHIHSSNSCTCEESSPAMITPCTAVPHATSSSGFMGLFALPLKNSWVIIAPPHQGCQVLTPKVRVACKGLYLKDAIFTTTLISGSQRRPSLHSYHSPRIPSLQEHQS